MKPDKIFIFDKESGTITGVTELARGLSTIKIPKTIARVKVKHIGDAAFKDCVKLTNIKLSEKIETLGLQSFARCTSLKNISMPDSIKIIGSESFKGCTSLESIEFPSNIEMIYSAAFSECKSLTECHFPVGIKVIDEYLFEGCECLTVVSIPETVTDISNNAFDGCESLADIYFDGTSDQWESINIGIDNDELSEASIHIVTCDICFSFDNISGTITGLIGIWNQAEDVEIPESIDGIIVRSIGKRAFADNISINTVRIPKTIVLIDEEAFNGCSSLANVYYDGSEEQWEQISIKDGNYPLAVASINYDPETNYFTFDETRKTVTGLTDEGKLLTYLNIPSEINGVPVKIIGANAFKDNDRIESVIISLGVESIGSQAFKRCPNLSTVSLPLSIKEICTGAFHRCASLKNINIPYSVTSIEDEAFYKCASLETLTIPDSVTNIGSRAFYECEKLRSIKLSSSFTILTKYIFADCTSLEEIAIPVGVKTIETGAFYGCKLLKSIIVPSTIEFISQTAFNGCELLSNIYHSGAKAKTDLSRIRKINDMISNSTKHCIFEHHIEDQNSDDGEEYNGISFSEPDPNYHRRKSLLTASCITSSIATVAGSFVINKLLKKLLKNVKSSKSLALRLLVIILYVILGISVTAAFFIKLVKITGMFNKHDLDDECED